MSSDGALASAMLGVFIPIRVVYEPIVILTTITTAGETIQFSLGRRLFRDLFAYGVPILRGRIWLLS